MNPPRYVGPAPSSRDLRGELIADLEQIEDNIALYKAGRDSAFQTVALQLRNVLLGGRRGLLLRVLPEAKFHPIANGDDVAAGDTSPDAPGKAAITILGHVEFRPPWRGQRASITLPIDLNKEPIQIEEWLEQWVVVPTVKIRELIASTANEEVAHTQSERGSLLRQLAGSGVIVVSPEDLAAGRLDRSRVAQETYQMAIVGIGEYVASRVRELLATP